MALAACSSGKDEGVGPTSPPPPTTIPLFDVSTQDVTPYLPEGLCGSSAGTVASPIIADVDGNGSVDAIVAVQCTPATAVNLAFTSALGQPKQLGTTFAGTHLRIQAGNPAALVVFEAKPVEGETPDSASFFEEVTLRWATNGFQRGDGRLLDRAAYFAATGGVDPLPPPPTTLPGEWTDVADHAKGSVLEVRGTSCDGSWANRGTGFLIDQNLVLTAAHVVRDNGQLTVTGVGGVELPVQVAGLDLDEDIALLVVDAPIDAQPFELATAPPRQGADVAVIGYSQRLNRLITGVISATDVHDLTYRDETESYTPTLMFLHDAATFPGDSGGPVLDRSGRVVGVNTAGGTFEVSDKRVAIPGIGWAVDARVVRTLLEAWDADERALSLCESHGQPTTEPPPTTPVPAAPPSYKVVRFDTVRGIARAFNVTPEQLTDLNGISNPNVIGVGQILRLPAEARPLGPGDVATITYTVIAGDTVAEIARRFRPVTPAEILALNGMFDRPDDLTVGQVLLLPQR